MNRIIIITWLLTLSAQVYAQPGNPGVNSPEILPDNTVIFRIKAPEAKNVSLIGTLSKDFKPIPMIKKDSVFEVKIGPLESNMYEYRFVVDGIPALDPGSSTVTRDGSWIENRLLIPGRLGDLLAVQNVPHGKVTAVWYPSPALGGDRRMLIYTPPGYETGKGKYPVMYLLHGGGGDEEGWINRGRANYILDNLIASKQAVPMIIVMTNGNPDTKAAPLDRPLNSEKEIPGIGSMASTRFEQSLVKDVIPYIEKNYRVVADADHRAVAGFSMGGYQSQNITNSNPGMFNYVGIMSMGLFSAFGNNAANYDKQKHVAQLKAVFAAKPKLYWIGIGKNDFLYKTVVMLRSMYDDYGFTYQYRESDGNHTWLEWRLYLTELAPKFFKQ